VSDEVQEIRSVTRSFVRDRLRPLEGWVEEHDTKPPQWDALLRESIEMGLYAANMPESAGGGGLDLPAQCAIWEELGHVSWPLTYVACVPNPVLLACTPRQRELYLDPVVAGTKKAAFALTEPDAGSDVYAMTTRATRTDGGWVLSGTKHFITNIVDADFVVVFAATGRQENGRAEISAFLVGTDNPGLRVTRRQQMMGWRGIQQSEFAMEDCFVSDDEVLGEIGAGLDLAVSLLLRVRVTLASYCTGFMDRIIEDVMQWADLRVVFGKPLSQKQGIQWMIAEMVAAADISRGAIADLARRAEQEELTARQAGTVKLFATQQLGMVADTAVQIFGGAGWCKDLEVERLYRDARVFRLIDGTDELQKGMIWRAFSSSRAHAGQAGSLSRV
jgi:acyl-CoA dehydrogenase